MSSTNTPAPKTDVLIYEGLTKEQRSEVKLMYPDATFEEEEKPQGVFKVTAKLKNPIRIIT